MNNFKEKKISSSKIKNYDSSNSFSKISNKLPKKIKEEKKSKKNTIKMLNYSNINNN